MGRRKKELTNQSEVIKSTIDQKGGDPLTQVAQSNLNDMINKVLNSLTYRERECIKLRYGMSDGCTYTIEEVGRIFNVTRECAKKVGAKAIRKLQHPLRARKLQSFLPGS